MLTHPLLPSWSPLSELRFLEKKRSGATAQIPHVHRTMIVGLSPSMMLLLLLSQRPVRMLGIGLSPSFCWIARSFSALIRLSQPQRRCVRVEHLRFIGIGTELHHQYPVGRIPFVVASHKLHTTSCNASSFCCCRLRVLSIPAKWKQLQCGQTYDRVTPPIPSTGSMIRLKKSVFF